MIIKQIPWQTIKEVWRTKLWIDRKSPIKPTNGLLFLGGYNKEIESNNATFFGVFDNDKLVGVNSGHAVEIVDDKHYYRSRGIYVLPEYREKGIAQMLLIATESQALKENKNYMWSMPRKSALPTYLKFGFELCSKEFEGMEFGPNYYVVKHLLS